MVSEYEGNEGEYMDSSEETKNQTVFKEDNEAAENEVGAEGEEKKTVNMDRNLAGFLCYLLWFITGIIFLVIEKENRFIRFHALQSIFVSVALFILNFFLTAVPIIGWLIGILLTPLYLFLWIFMMWKAYQGKYFKLPLLGDIAEKQV